MHDVAWVHDACWSGLKIDIAYCDDAPVVCAVCGKPGVTGRGVSAVDWEVLRKSGLPAVVDPAAKLIETLKALVDRKMIGVEAFDDEFDGKRIDLYFDGKPQMVLRLRADCGAYHGVEVKPIREMAPLYAMGSRAQELQDLDELKKMLVQAGPKCRVCLACAGKASSGVQFQDILNRYKVFVDPSVEGIELRNGDGSLAAKVKP